ncbi:metallophosphoesterase family protein [Paenibacillus thalictri]|uniref:Phosphoesterase n=1 Tax=Paenibacillus thalictri TaxID=2527873 RepID=A0A4Q9DN04_9BACL|nr:metallophosphoesterase family protein [Paenibacillus thalictri]TBL75234.1 metallophosphoesterase [Paenibacillus thalictri]
MRLAVISDMHGNATAFEEVIRDLKEMSPDAVVCLGDIVMKGPQPVECIDMVRSLNPLAVVRGNYDDKFLKSPKTPENYKQELQLRALRYDSEKISLADQEWLTQLPHGHTCDLEGIQTEMYHASPQSLYKVTYPWATNEELEQLHQQEQTKLVLYGHIHHAYVRYWAGRTIVNCGSIGMPFDRDNRASYAVIDFAGSNLAVQLRRVEYDIEKALKIAKELQMPDADAFEYAIKTARYPYNEKKQLPIS